MARFLTPSSRRLVSLLAWLSLLLSASLVVAQEGEAVEREARTGTGDVSDEPLNPEEFRTQEDDAAEEGGGEPPSATLGRVGAIEVPISVEHGGQVTVAIYRPAVRGSDGTEKPGQLVRILGQLMDLEAGEYVARWDGMDLFGNLVEPGTPLEVRTITNKTGVLAYYEFTVGQGGNNPAFGRPSENEEGDTIATGWLADHTPPSSVVAVGDRVIIGATLAEAGNNMVGVDLQGRKRWGGSLEGWRGPKLLTSDGRAVYALHSRGAGVWRIDPMTGKKTKVMGAVPHEVTAFAATPISGGDLPSKLLLIGRSREDRQSAFRYAMGNAAVDATRSRPQVLDGSAPTEFLISPRTAFANVFTTPGNPQNAAGMVVKGGDAYTVVVFNEPVTFGSMLLGAMPGVAEVELYALKAGVAYEDEMSPLDTGGAASDEVGGMDGFNLDEFDENWTLVGRSGVDGRLNILTPDASVTTGAIYIKALPPKNTKRDWKPSLKMARLLRERVETVGGVGGGAVPEARVVTHAGDAVQPEGDHKEGETNAELGWSYRTAAPISGVYPTHVVLDLRETVELDGLVLLNCVNPRVEVQVFEPGPEAEAIDPVQAAGDDAKWRTVATHKGGRDKKLRYLSASTDHNEAFVDFDERVTTRAVRFRILEGFRAGKWGKGDDDPYRVACDAVALLRRADAPEERPPSHVFMVVDAETGAVESEHASDDYADVAAMAVSPTGTIYAASRLSGLLQGRVEEGTLVLGFHAAVSPFVDPISIAASGDRVAVGDAGARQVLRFDRDRELLHRIGNGNDREPGAWDPMTIAKPSSVAIASDGSIWIAEASYAPKRVARYSADGTFIEEHLGPTMYGGGGDLDPDLKSFYYRGMQFALDWEAGTSRLAALNDQIYNPRSPVQGGNTFGGTSAGHPVYHDGHRYITGDNQISRLPDDSARWLPAAVWGSALNNSFLLDKP